MAVSICSHLLHIHCHRMSCRCMVMACFSHSDLHAGRMQHVYVHLLACLAKAMRQLDS